MSRQEDILRIFLRQRQALVRYAASVTGSSAEAEDLVQEAWLRFDSIAKDRELAEPEGYLRRIVRNLIFDGVRRKGVERRLFDSEANAAANDLPSDAPSALAQLTAREELETVRRTVGAMPERMRLAFEMHRFQGIRLVDIAERLAISKSTAQELVVEGLERCRRALRKSH